VLARLPSGAVAFRCERGRDLLQVGRHRVVPSIQESEEPDDREHLDDLTVVPVPSELLEPVRGDLVRHEGGVAREPESRTLGVVIAG
jgi:hypothetical protein